MSLPIHWHDAAIDDLLELVTYIAERDPQAARRLRTRIEAAIALVAEHPYLHQVGACPARGKSWPIRISSWSTR
ncbi:type II toxin-antitoxin system RelE/ParE family toxin [Modicisalibacter radicis]|uniref:type II toxin-antitoxin system RelE/ParE family toxin n=1 Tax=Halomonas sp. EAR18 TaxID=2518972 RepID=UPI001FCED0EC|nr:type II toxin-antitoxin system RelE/ParE family toxin [Halomonas sp. EAR18]